MIQCHSSNKCWELQELIQHVSKRFATVFEVLLYITLEREVN